MGHETGSKPRAGTKVGRHAGRRRPLLVGLAMVVLGVALSAIAIQLGG